MAYRLLEEAKADARQKLQSALRARPTPQVTSSPTSAPDTTPPPAFQGVTMTPTNPANDLRGQTFSPGQTADRMDLAQQYSQQFREASRPQFQADLETANRAGASRGQLGSGQLNTRFGDITRDRDLRQMQADQQFKTQALEGTIEDTYRRLGIAQDERAYQTGAQNQAFGQAVTLQQLLDQLRTSEQNRNAQLYGIGQSGHNALTNFRRLQAGQYGDTASSLQDALAGLIGNRMDATTADQGTDRLRQILGY